ncbi:MAG: hypothetical protein HY509_02050 [Acidobacteria bacterium]|nr:hypothetical protein [Acidobacteriota bacterium]
MYPFRAMGGFAAALLLLTAGTVRADDSRTGPAEWWVLVSPVPAAETLASPPRALTLSALDPVAVPLPATEGLARRFFRDLSFHLERESRRDAPANTQAFLSAQWALEDTRLEEFRAWRAEALLNEALDEWVDDRIDRALEDVPGLRRLNAFVDWVEDLDLRSLHSQDSAVFPVPAAASRPHPTDLLDLVQLRLDLNPKLRLRGTWAGFAGQIDLPLDGESLRLRLHRSLRPGVSAQVESRIPLQDDGQDWTSLGLSIVF